MTDAARILNLHVPVGTFKIEEQERLEPDLREVPGQRDPDDHGERWEPATGVIELDVQDPKHWQALSEAVERGTVVDIGARFVKADHYYVQLTGIRERRVGAGRPATTVSILFEWTQLRMPAEDEPAAAPD